MAGTKTDPKQVAGALIREAQDQADEIINAAKRKASEISDEVSRRADIIISEAKKKAKAEVTALDKKPSVSKKTYALTEGKSDTVVICCSDSRFQNAFQLFVEEELAIRTYYPFVMPGAIEMLALSGSIPKFASGLLRYLKFFAKDIAVKNIVIIMHEDCGWYRHFVPKFIQLKGLAKDQQINDMLTTKSLLKQEFPELKVQMYYAAINATKSVEFYEITENKG